MGSAPQVAVLAHGGDHVRWEWGTAIGEWTFDTPVVVALAVAAFLYVSGVRRVRDAGGSWPTSRLAAMAAGLVVMAAGLLSGLVHYERTSFGAHSAQHLLIGMIGPLLIVLAAPLTLALRAAPGGARPALHRMATHPATAIVGHPVVGMAVFTGTLVVLYFTPLYDLALRNDAVHVWLHAHLFVAGVLFAWPLVGVAPLPVRVSHVSRLLVVVVAVPFHAFVAVALLSATTPLALDWYSAATGRSAADLLADQRIGAGLLWAAGELLSLAMIGIVVARWLGSEQRMVEHAERLERAGAPA